MGCNENCFFFVCLLSVFLPLVAAAAAAEGRNEQFEIGKLKRVVDRVVNERRWMCERTAATSVFNHNRLPVVTDTWALTCVCVWYLIRLCK